MERVDALTAAVELVRALATRGGDGQTEYLEDHDSIGEADVRLILAGQTRLATTLLGLVAYHEERPAEAVLDVVATALMWADRGV